MRLRRVNHNDGARGRFWKNAAIESLYECVGDAAFLFLLLLSRVKV